MLTNYILFCVRKSSLTITETPTNTFMKHNYHQRNLSTAAWLVQQLMTNIFNTPNKCGENSACKILVEYHDLNILYSGRLIRKNLFMDGRVRPDDDYLSCHIFFDHYSRHGRSRHRTWQNSFPLTWATRQQQRELLDSIRQRSP